MEIRFSAINLGCTKNLVDLEHTLGELLTYNGKEDLDFIFYTDPDDENVEYLILNTCGFLSSSRQEAEETIKYYDDLGKKIILTGCYIPVKNDKFLSSLKHLEAVIPFKDAGNIKEIFETPTTFLVNNQVPPLIKGRLGGVNKNEIQKNTLKKNFQKLKKEQLKKYLNKIGGDNLKSKAHIFGSETIRAYMNADKGYEYLKIAEGCDNNCTFCIIPNIRGKQKSRTIEDISKEVKTMIKLGIKEIEIIAQDTTRYGTDLYGEPKLIELLQNIDKIDGDFKYRLFYMYPDNLSLKHLEELSKLQKLIPYFDFPFQHISPKILKKMGRFYDDEHIYKLIENIKQNFKNSFFHTNFIIGFPGETEEDFKKLLDFAKKVEFDSVSVFGYHDEELAPSSKLKDKVPENVIQRRVKEFEKLQEKIYKKKEKTRLGKKCIGYIEEICDDMIMVRPEICAPEVDDLDVVKFEDMVEGEVGIGEKVGYIYK